MRVSVRSAENRLLAKWLRIAAIFYANELMHVNLVKNLNVKIILRSPDKNFKDKGSCEWDETDGPPNPRYFTIVLAKGKNKREIFRTLAHEMVHLRQYAKNEMTGLLTGSHIHIWKGSVYKLNSSLSPKKIEENQLQLQCDGSDYFYLPWEIEAYGLEVGLFSYFRKFVSSCFKYNFNHVLKQIKKNEVSS